MEYNKAYRQCGVQTTMPRISMVMQPKMMPPIAMAVRLKITPCITMAWQTRMLGNAMVARQMTMPHIEVVAWWNMSWLFLHCLTLPSCPLAVPPSRCTSWLMCGLRLKLPPPSNTTATSLYHPPQPPPPLPLPPGHRLRHCRHCRHCRNRCHCHYRGQTPVVYC
jgi:hypothetical protein